MYPFKSITRIVVVAGVVMSLTRFVFANEHQESGAGQEQKRTVMENLPGHVPLLFQWPEFNAIPPEKLVTGTENKHIRRAKAASIDWIGKIIDQSWLPDDPNYLTEHLVMIQNHYGPGDTTHIEWEKNGYLIRVSQSMTVFTTAVTSSTDKVIVVGDTLAQKVSVVASFCGQIIRNIPEVEATTEDKTVINIVPEGTRTVLLEKCFEKALVKECDDGVVGYPAKPDFRAANDSRWFEYWWGRVGWWTDGHSIGLYTLKIQAGQWRASYSPGMDSTWFEGSAQRNKSGKRIIHPAEQTLP